MNVLLSRIVMPVFMNYRRMNDYRTPLYYFIHARLIIINTL